MRKERSFIQGFGISFGLMVFSIISSLVLSIYMGSLYISSAFNENSKFDNPIFGILGSFTMVPFSTIFLFLILNNVGVKMSYNKGRKKGMLYGYLLALLPIILFLLIAFLAAGYH